MRIQVAVLALVMAVPAGAGAQRIHHDNMVRMGDTIRVRLQEGTFEGTVQRTGDTLLVLNAGRAWAVPKPSVKRLDVQRGTRARPGNVIGGMIVGAPVGAFVGGLLGVLLECGTSCSDNGEMAGFAGVMGGSALGAITGLVTGGVLGAKSRKPNWVRAIYPDR